MSGKDIKFIAVGTVFFLLFILIGFFIRFYIKSEFSNIATMKDMETMNRNPYDASILIDTAIKNLKESPKKAEIITDVRTGEKVMALSFKGLSDPDTTREILHLMSVYGRKGTFFLPGIAAAEDAEAVQAMVDGGHKVGSNTLTGLKNLEEYGLEELVVDFCRTNNIIKVLTNQENILLLCNGTKYTPKVLQAAFASGNKKVVSISHYISYQSFSTYTQVLDYIKRLDDGTIFTIKLNGTLDEDEYVSVKKQDKPAVDKQPGIDVQKETKNLSEEERLLQVVEWILKALDEVQYKTVFVEDISQYNDPNFKRLSEQKQGELAKVYTEAHTGSKYISFKKPVQKEMGTKEIKRKNQIEALRKKNNGKLAEEIYTIYTTEQAVSYTFSGIANTAVLIDVLQKLDELNGKGTFFVTGEEIENYGDAIKSIASAGHEIGICLKVTETADYYSTCSSILDIQEKIETLCGKKPTLVRYAYVVNMTDEVLEAISSTGCKVVWQDLSFASSKVGKQGTFDQVLAYAYHKGNISVPRGYIVFFRMDFYEDNSLIGKLMVDFTKNRVDTVAYQDDIEDNGSSYRIKTLESLMNSSYVYQYPVPKTNMLSSVKDKIYPGHLKDKTNEGILEKLIQRYIGNPEANTPATLPGFSEEELSRLNTAGTFTDDKVIFLTFDDWSSDKPVNQILYVLKKYDIKASFFIRTEYMEANPNLLRAIALGGHDIGSHTDAHLPFANSQSFQGEDDVKSVFISLSEEEISSRKEDLWTSYNKLQSVIGDIEIDGIPALNKIFRPPTLAMSKEGMKAILDMGFTYIVSGDFSTHDYAAENAMELASTILTGIQRRNGSYKTLGNGSIIILHMSDDSDMPNRENDITAEALDIVIPKLLEEGYRFVRLSEYLSDEE
ncbi:polysaccharide deacetylase family protein [Thermotalea metallivorans]|uniref:Peptidoglycan-N-acetylglucosamine deacetylase n=1 Tax=Thermotalea metallivorans TaxID=520762 RepID=A0A140L8Y2_9FIRM|nr:polysaccharide deacetylase family protein [Thermotalea metallivorans]KXG77007.1 Peptidoglycan-N-acetylglucosamine deacetylase [Thermotalea metallivorans]